MLSAASVFSWWRSSNKELVGTVTTRPRVCSFSLFINVVSSLWRRTWRRWRGEEKKTFLGRLFLVSLGLFFLNFIYLFNFFFNFQKSIYLFILFLLVCVGGRCNLLFFFLTNWVLLLNTLWQSSFFTWGNWLVRFRQPGALPPPYLVAQPNSTRLESTRVDLTHLSIENINSTVGLHLNTTVKHYNFEMFLRWKWPANWIDCVWKSWLFK